MRPHFNKFSLPLQAITGSTHFISELSQLSVPELQSRRKGVVTKRMSGIRHCEDRKRRNKIQNMWKYSIQYYNKTHKNVEIVFNVEFVTSSSTHHYTTSLKLEIYVKMVNALPNARRRSVLHSDIPDK